MRCGGYDFELAYSNLKEKESRLALVQCSSCGGVVGIVMLGKNEHWANGTKLLATETEGKEFEL